MPAYYPERDNPTETEPKRRFYPNQGMQTTAIQPRPAKRNESDASYLMRRHPILLQRLYDAADSHLSTYRAKDFIYDAYPDYLSLRLMRDRLLLENRSLTEEFLNSGCPTEWLNLLTDTILSELLCRRRCAYRSPKGEANTTSVQLVSRS